MPSFSSLSILFLISLLFLNTHPTFSQTTTCKSLKLSKTFDHCNDLPTLSAVLHWTYNPSNSALSVAFTASPPKPDGWVAWGLNPKGTGMLGSQVFLAHKPSSSGPVTVNTYNLSSYGDVSMGPISYNITSLSAQDSSGVITISGTWVLPKGESKLNQVWQVGPMVNGKVGKHDFRPANLGSKLELSLTGAGPSRVPTAPAGAPRGSPSGPAGAPKGSPFGPAEAPRGSPSGPARAPKGSPSGPTTAPEGPTRAPEGSPSRSVGAPAEPARAPEGSPSGLASSPSGASGASPESSPNMAGERLVSGVLALGAMVVCLLF